MSSYLFDAVLLVGRKCLCAVYDAIYDTLPAQRGYAHNRNLALAILGFQDSIIWMDLGLKYVSGPVGIWLQMLATNKVKWNLPVSTCSPQQPFSKRNDRWMSKQKDEGQWFCEPLFFAHVMTCQKNLSQSISWPWMAQRNDIANLPLSSFTIHAWISKTS